MKASALVALPFLVWVWAGHLPSTRWRNFARACAGAVGVFAAVFAAVTLLAGVNLGWVTMINASSRLVNWLSPPTAAGELLHGAHRHRGVQVPGTGSSRSPGSSAWPCWW